MPEICSTMIIFIQLWCQSHLNLDVAPIEKHVCGENLKLENKLHYELLWIKSDFQRKTVQERLKNLFISNKNILDFSAIIHEFSQTKRRTAFLSLKRLCHFCSGILNTQCICCPSLRVLQLYRTLQNLPKNHLPVRLMKVCYEVLILQ